ncbi:hypothetical protein CspeluHIS016_0701800 [Cutaneotrichosporon spelunceum]|uniref:TECPR1-like DysF domain-containing protein n=1 Tax=Cutaneotrichosporon spelunceum TaxID=1672016 RepID=A0AAD3YDG1_9TREE|nr:hypothetical protein CspeluHIS016_0701800 [Cutaneotrichosporon spelunceum]
MDDDIVPYIPIPLAGVPILPPDVCMLNALQGAGTPLPNALQGAGTPPPAAAAATFPPPPSMPPPRKLIPTTTNLSTNVSDLVLSSLLPANLPKLPSTHAPGRARELTSQREGLGLNVMSNNFRRFVTKVGPIFWLQDRIEEVLFWQKPVWTWAWLLTWTFICFQPRVLLFLPTALLLVLYTWMQERKNPVPSLFGVSFTPTPVGSVRVGSDDDPSSSGLSIASDGDGTPVGPPKEAEPSVDYLMNMRAIQNLMGLIADMFDVVTPYLSLLGGKNTSPTAFPLRPTAVVLALIPPTVLMPLTPLWAIKYLLLPVGIVPPLLFHPNFMAAIEAAPRSKQVLQALAFAEEAAMTDALSDDLGRRPISRVEVWENERLDPTAVSKTPLPPGTWSVRFLRAGERAAWVKVRQADSAWAAEDVGDEGPTMALSLREHWNFVPGEDWRVDVWGLWSDVGTDGDGWAYSDDGWQKPSPRPQDDGVRRVTRRRRWWRRVYRDDREV